MDSFKIIKSFLPSKLMQQRNVWHFLLGTNIVQGFSGSVDLLNFMNCVMGLVWCRFFVMLQSSDEILLDTSCNNSRKFPEGFTMSEIKINQFIIIIIFLIFNGRGNQFKKKLSIKII